MISPAKKGAACRLSVALSLLLLLTACGSNYQAPISEQGEVQRISAPEIVDSRSGDSRLRTPANRAATVIPSSPAISASSNARGNDSQSSASSAGSHRVRAGDTLFSIAFEHDLDFRSLAIANGLSPPYTIFVDQILNLSLNDNNQSRNPIASGSLGTAVSNSSVARSQAGNGNSRAVLRQPVNNRSTGNPDWQWPYRGRVLRGFQAGLSKGLDISGNRGDAVLAAADGDVVYSGRDIQGTGELIIIRHTDRYLSAYAHNSVMLVSEGSRVRAGEKIAEIGENPAGIAMLHFEIRQDGNSIDPVRLLPAR